MSLGVDGLKFRFDQRKVIRKFLFVSSGLSLHEAAYIRTYYK